MKSNKTRLIDAFIPEPIDVVITFAVFTALLITGYFGLLNRIFALMDENILFRIPIVLIALLIGAPGWLRLKKKLRKYQDDKWDDK